MKQLDRENRCAIKTSGKRPRLQNNDALAEIPVKWVPERQITLRDGTALGGTSLITDIQNWVSLLWSCKSGTIVTLARDLLGNRRVPKARRQVDVNVDRNLDIAKNDLQNRVTNKTFLA